MYTLELDVARKARTCFIAQTQQSDIRHTDTRVLVRVIAEFKPESRRWWRRRGRRKRTKIRNIKNLYRLWHQRARRPLLGRGVSTHSQCVINIVECNLNNLIFTYLFYECALSRRGINKFRRRMFSIQTREKHSSAQRTYIGCMQVRTSDTMRIHTRAKWIATCNYGDCRDKTLSRFSHKTWMSLCPLPGQKCAPSNLDVRERMRNEWNENLWFSANEKQIIVHSARCASNMYVFVWDVGGGFIVASGSCVFISFCLCASDPIKPYLGTREREREKEIEAWQWRNSMTVLYTVESKCPRRRRQHGERSTRTEKNNCVEETCAQALTRSIGSRSRLRAYTLNRYNNELKQIWAHVKVRKSEHACLRARANVHYCAQ